MKNISDFLNECLDSEVNSNNIQEANETIKDEKSFREAARAKFEEVFGDELDEDKLDMREEGGTRLADLVEKGEWGELIGMLNKSFAPDQNKE